MKRSARLALMLVASAAMICSAVPAASAAPLPPTITGFSPSSGVAGTVVTITGTNLKAKAVTFNGIPSMYSIVSPTQITATVPSAATTGPIAVTTAGGTATSSTSFVLNAPTLGLSQDHGPPSTKLSVSGTGFGASEFVDIYFDTTDSAVAVTDTSGSFAGISFTVPSSTLPGTHWVSAKGERTALAAQITFAVETDWPQFHYSANHRGANPHENVLSPSTVSGLDMDWSYSTGGAVDSSPAVVDGVVYFGSSDGNLYALDASTGNRKWSYPTGGAITSSPAVANGIVYFGSSASNTLFAVDASDGSLVWSDLYAYGGGSPVVAGGSVYVAELVGFLGAFDAATGVQEWAFGTGGAIESSPAVANGVVYFGSDDGNVYAVKTSNGKKLWSYGVPAAVHSSPAVAGGIVYFEAFADVYAVNASNGTTAWTFSEPTYFDASPAVAGGLVYSGTGGGNIYALNALTGDQAWANVLIEGPSNSPAIANGVVYAGTGGDQLLALSASSGTTLWYFPFSAAVDSSPAIANGTVYVGSDDGNMYAFDLSAGMQSVQRPDPASLKPNRSLRPQPGPAARSS